MSVIQQVGPSPELRATYTRMIVRFEQVRTLLLPLVEESEKGVLQLNAEAIVVNNADPTNVGIDAIAARFNKESGDTRLRELMTQVEALMDKICNTPGFRWENVAKLVDDLEGKQ